MEAIILFVAVLILCAFILSMPLPKIKEDVGFWKRCSKYMNDMRSSGELPSQREEIQK